MTSLAERRIVVTGASSGIGEAAARLFALAGTDVVLISQDEANLTRVANEIRSAGGTAHTQIVDFAHHEQVEGLFDRLEQAFGPIDTLINNAGVGLNASVLSTEEVDLRFLFQVNFFALRQLCQEALNRMGERGGGTIVNVTSASARLGQAGISAYSATKGAVHAYTQALRTEAIARHVWVCECLPISVSTPFFENVRGRSYQPMGMVQTPETVARAIVRAVKSSRPPAEILPFRLIRIAFLLEALLPWLPAHFASMKHPHR